MNKKVVWIDCADITVEEKTMVTALQGIVNRGGAEIFITTGRQSWINVLEDPRSPKEGFTEGYFERYPTTDHIWMDEFSRIYGFEFVLTALKDAIRSYIDRFKGILLYDDASRTTAAITAAGIYDLLPVSSKVYDDYKDVLSGLEVKCDYTNRFADRLEAQQFAVKALLEHTTDEFVSSYFAEEESGTYQNDFAVMKKAFCYELNHVTKSNMEHVGETEKESYDEREEKLLLPILDHVRKFGFVWGWGKGGENAIASITAERGIVLMCANMPNGSFFANIESKSECFKQNHINASDFKVENKMYIAFMVNEGDTYKAASSFWNYGSWMQKYAHKDLKINWGVDGLVFKYFPCLGDYYYSNKADSDYFFSATTAYGYIHPDFLNKKLIWEFADEAKKILRYTDTKYLDPWWFSVRDEDGNERRWEWVKAMEAEGLTQWNNRNETTFEPDFPVIRSDLYYPFEKAPGDNYRDRAQAIANTLRSAREKQPADAPFCTVVYGGDPYGFKLIMDALPKDGFEAVRLDELFAVANRAKAAITGIRAEYDLKGNVGTWDPTNDSKD